MFTWSWSGRLAGAVRSSWRNPVRRHGLPEAILAWGLISFLLLGLLGSFSGRAVELNTRIVIINLVVELAVVLSIIAVLRLRGFSVHSLAGLSKISFLRVLVAGTVLLLAAYPLVSLAEKVTQSLIGGGSTKQSIVELFSGSQTIEQRIMIIVFAVVIAPMAEEFLFRFFLYGVLRRYFGRFFGITGNALLFAAVHTHLPSFAPLLVLGNLFQHRLRMERLDSCTHDDAFALQFTLPHPARFPRALSAMKLAELAKRSSRNFCTDFRAPKLWSMPRVMIARS